MWKLSIEQAENGFLLEGDFKKDGSISKMVFEEDEDKFGGINALQKVLWEVIEYFRLVGSKYDKKRLEVIINEQNENT